MKRRLYQGSDLSRVLSIEELAGFARRRVPHVVFEYIEAGAEDERTLAANRGAFDRWRFCPDTLVDTSSRSIATTLFGKPSASPLIVAPTGFNGLAWPRGDVALARAAAAAGIPFTLSSFSNTALEEVANEAGGRLWLQLYVLRERELSRRLLERAAQAGYEALVVTTDANVMSGREWDKRNFIAPGKPTLRCRLDMLAHPGWLRTHLKHGMPALENVKDFIPPHQQSVAQRMAFVVDQLQPNLSWDDIRWLRGLWHGRLVVKGILNAGDARRAFDCGADGIVVTNHGGRQLESCVSSLDVLSEIVDTLAGRLTVLVDGGFRRGGDILKAVALGADGVMTGRATLYGLTAAGEAGVSHAIGLLHGEMNRTLGMLGRNSIAALGPDVLRKVS
ncbi:alpha-hydroxy acid oxidase [Chitinasiproducens palmae]|uniref:(S)-mandelate dehydrogenase n=1 Tax=Chitinasiproducens palmae TaxID=1770053 RepID=A0A1H2PTG1_9BURK|nr:alpha-hydroxy acid oxidase [Chitinasiproducens palmae]SDV50393.1 (S)-mandelate dehydrogenase [Chitinasiproducens palmae]